MKNILLVYRAQVFKSEIDVHLKTYKNDRVVLVVEDIIQQNIVNYLTKDYTIVNIFPSTFNIITLEDFLQGELNMKFDAVVANPPYQKIVGPKHSQSIWHKIVEKSIKHLKDGGTMTMVHPDSWRISTDFKSTKKLLLSKTIVSLEMFDEAQGMKTFGAATPYDVYTLINEPNLDNKKTRIVGSDNVVVEKDLTNVGYIPNGSFELFDNLIVKPNEEKISVIKDSTYHTQKNTMSLDQVGEFKYPCVYTTTKDGSINFWYSNTKKRHFDVPKVIWSNGMASSVVIDKEGQYGLTQFAYAVVDKPENLEMIQKAMESKKFLELMQNSQGKNQKYNRRVISLFRKDFWKEFV